MQWRDGAGNVTDRYMPYESWRKMTERAAAGAESGGGAVPKGFSEAAVAEGKAAWEDLQGTADTGVKAKAWRELKSVGAYFTQDVKAMPAISKLGAITLGVSAFEVGWGIGCEISECEGSFWSYLFGGQESEAATGGSVDWYAKKYYPYAGGTPVCEVGGYGTCNQGSKVFPQPIFEIRWGQLGGKGEQWYAPDVLTANGCAVDWFYGEAPLGLQEADYGTTGCVGAPGGVVPTKVAFVTDVVQCMMGQTTEGCAVEPETMRKESAPEALEGPEATEVGEECFRGEIYCGGLPGWWYNHDKQAQEVSTGEALVENPLGLAIPEPAKTEPYEEYGEELEELELIPEYEELPFEKVDDEREPGTVIFVKPTWGTEVEPESTVEVQYNPDFRVIPPIREGETFKEYSERVESETGLKPQKVPLPENATDPSTGPEGASYTLPKEGTAVEPGTEFKVETNPETAPYPAEGGGWSPPSIPSVDLSPLLETGLGCDTFPFGVFCWFGEAVEAFAVSPSCPLEVNLPIDAFGGTEHLDVNGCEVGETVMAPLRILILALATIGLVLLFAKQAMGTGGEDA